MFRVEISQRCWSWQVATTEAQPSPIQQMPSASLGENTSMPFCPTKSESNGPKAVAGLSCIE